MIPTPYIKAKIQNSFLFKDETNNELTDCFIISASSFINRPILFTAHLSTGALFSGVPVSEIRHQVELKNNLCNFTLEELQPWGCLGERMGVVRLPYLKDYRCDCLVGGIKISGYYVMTFFFKGGFGFEEEPSQMKTMNMVALCNGQFALLPNNKILFLDKHFTESVEWPKYKRNETYFMAD